MKCNYKSPKPMTEKDMGNLNYALRNYIFNKMVEAEKEENMEKLEEAGAAYELLKIINKGLSSS